MVGSGGRFAAEHDLCDDGDGDLDDALADVAGLLNLVNARLVRLAGRALRTAAWESSGLRSPANFLAHRAGLSSERARQVVEGAERRREFPSIVAAFERGELSPQQVAEVVKAPAWADGLLHDMATISTVGTLRRAMRSNMFEGPPDEPDPDPAPPRDRVSFGIGRTADRFVEIHHIVHWLDGGPTDTWNLVSLCPRHHKLRHQGAIGITGDADEFDGLEVTDAAGDRISRSGRAKPATADPSTPVGRYTHPLSGRFDWNWVGLGWVHPDVQAHRRRRGRADAAA